MRYKAALSWVLVLLAGCGQGLPVVPVSGVVLLDGSPLANASITTQPIGIKTLNPGPGSFGRTDAEGRFELELVTPAIRGAIIGEHRVMIQPASSAQKSAAPKIVNGIKVFSDEPVKETAAEKWPASFSDGSLRIQVPDKGTKEIRLELTRGKGGAKSFAATQQTLNGQ
jgi:hypothetical protein